MSKKKTIEETYQKLTQKEHVLKRPGMYIGSVDKTMEELWVKENDKDLVTKKMVEYSPGFIKIFDEILTNALDHSCRDPTLNYIKVNYSKETGEISVLNNGTGIPVVMHKDHNMYVPELIFGHLLSGSNYDDTQQRTGAGQNGIGIKCILHTTDVPLFNGLTKQAKDIEVGDILIGDDGNPRKVLNKCEGYGEMYKVSQHFGNSYVVNKDHILTLHMPDHKVIFWNCNGWDMLWWDNENKIIRSKFLRVFDKKIRCQECNLELSSNMKRHYKRQHKSKQYPQPPRSSPTYGDLNDPIVLEKYNEMKKFANTIKQDSVFDISISDFMKLNKTTQRRFAGLRGNCVNWSEKKVELDPYVLGLWLGDGMKCGRQYACYVEKDPQIIEYLQSWGQTNDANIEQSVYNKYAFTIKSLSRQGKKNSSPLRNLLKLYNLVDNKHIPKEYLINSREVRLKVLAGLIDTDGTVTRDGTRISIVQSHKHKKLVDDIIYLVRSLGFCCRVRSYMANYTITNGEKHSSLAYKINITGNIQDIPTKLPRKKCNNTKSINTDKTNGYIKIEKVQDDHYVGLAIDGNQRFVINDFTVTHNCSIIFSKRFVVETVDSENSLKFVQEYSDNMSNRSKPKITKNSNKSYTKITFVPDYAKFKMKGLEDDTISIINKRVYDCIACTREDVQVYLNGEKLKGKGLVDYANYFFEKVEDKPVVKMYHDKIIHKDLIWEFIVVPSERFEHISFVNGNSTYQGGKHVDHVVYQVVNKLKTLLETKKKLKEVKPAFIRERLFLFLRATVINPAFSSQTKEQLTTPSKDFGCKVEVSDKYIDKLWKSPIIEDIVQFCKAKETMDLAKSTDGKKKSKIFIPKLEDALWAGTSKSNSCILILTEGDSAKTFAMWGRSIVGPERYGIMPLKGKCVWEYTTVPLWNGEIKHAKDIKIGDELIGDDGNKRKVLTLFKDTGKMYEIQQDRGDSYKVNDEHILTLCVPDHKSIYWNNENYSWRALYWDKTEKQVKLKEIASHMKIKCKECSLTVLKSSLKRHYKRRHQDIKYEKQKYLNDINMDDPLVIQARHKLQEFLKTIDDNKILDLSIKDYLNVQQSLRRKLKGLRGQCVNWEHKDVLLDPYVLGLWLGDGSKSGYSYACDGKNDPEIMNYLNEWGKNNDAYFKQCGKYNYNISSIDNFRMRDNAPLKKVLSMYNLVNNKHIPKEFLINSKEIRLKVLAGLIDTDGYICKDGTIEIVQSHKHKKLADDIIYLARSLGFYTHVTKRTVGYEWKGKKYTEAYRIKISGNTSEIPTLLPRKQSTSTKMYNMKNSTGLIKVTPIDDDNYVGIGIDGNNRFLINDFTVTHNCLNVRDASVSQLMNNEEINNIKQIIGLKHGVNYTNTNDLRYGKVMILTDADVDGLTCGPEKYPANNNTDSY